MIIPRMESLRLLRFVVSSIASPSENCHCRKFEPKLNPESCKATFNGGRVKAGARARLGNWIEGEARACLSKKGLCSVRVIIRSVKFIRLRENYGSTAAYGHWTGRVKARCGRSSAFSMCARRRLVSRIVAWSFATTISITCSESFFSDVQHYWCDSRFEDTHLFCTSHSDELKL